MYLVIFAVVIAHIEPSGNEYIRGLEIGGISEGTLYHDAGSGQNVYGICFQAMNCPRASDVDVGVQGRYYRVIQRKRNVEKPMDRSDK